MENLSLWWTAAVWQDSGLHEHIWLILISNLLHDCIREQESRRVQECLLTPPEFEYSSQQLVLINGESFWKEQSRPRHILLPTVMGSRLWEKEDGDRAGLSQESQMLHALPIVWNFISNPRSSLLATRWVTLVRRRSRTLLMSMLSLLWVLSDTTELPKFRST